MEVDEADLSFDDAFKVGDSDDDRARHLTSAKNKLSPEERTLLTNVYKRRKVSLFEALVLPDAQQLQAVKGKLEADEVQALEAIGVKYVASRKQRPVPHSSAAGPADAVADSKVFIDASKQLLGIVENLAQVAKKKDGASTLGSAKCG